jgi:uncharacterized membrane protein
MMTAPDDRPASRVPWLLPAGLLALAAVPVAAGAVRLAELAGGHAIAPGNARFFAAPVPVVLHILGASLFCVLGAFQFAAGFRRRRPGWHRAVGRLLIVCGLAAGLSGLWMTLFYPHVEGDGPLLYGFRLLFGSAMLVCIVLAFIAIRRRDVAQHRAWITRGYAIGMGAGTQVLVHLPSLVLGKPGELGRALLMGAGWAINVAAAEWSIRRQRALAEAPARQPRASSLAQRLGEVPVGTRT